MDPPAGIGSVILCIYPVFSHLGPWPTSKTAHV